MEENDEFTSTKAILRQNGYTEVGDFEFSMDSL